MNDNINEVNEDTYSTKDLVLATFLKLNGVKLAKGYNPSSKSWSFEDSENCTNLALVLRNGESKVDILEYEATRRNLLSMVYDKKE